MHVVRGKKTKPGSVERLFYERMHHSDIYSFSAEDGGKHSFEMFVATEESTWCYNPKTQGHNYVTFEVVILKSNI
jgi:hypothetical protein